MQKICFNRNLLYGCGALEGLSDLIKGKGERCLLVTGKSSLKSSGLFSYITNLLKKGGVKDIKIFEVQGEPDTVIVERCVESSKDVKFVVAVGGGSVIDTAKASCGLLTNKGPVERYMELTNTTEKFINDPLPLFAIPTTAGTGSEASQNAVILSKKDSIKASIRDSRLLPEGVILDPEMILNVPENIAAYSGMDALVQLIEAYTGKKTVTLLDSLIEDAIRRIKNSFFIYIKDRKNKDAASDMLLASYISGLALANIGLGAIHALARPLGSAGIPHGLICAILLPYVIEKNIEYNRPRFDKIAEIFEIKERSKRLADFFYNMNRKLDIPQSLKNFSQIIPDINIIIEKSKGGSLKNNPKELSDNDIEEIITNALKGK